MSETRISLPVANVGSASWPALRGALDATFSPSEGLVVRARDIGAPIYAPFRSVVSFLPAGTPITEGGRTFTTDALVLDTFPTDYLKLRTRLTAPVPARCVFINVDAVEAERLARDLLVSTPIRVEPGRTDAVIGEYMVGRQKLLAAPAGARVGTAGSVSGSFPRRCDIRMFDHADAELHPVFYVFLFAELLEIDADRHPLLELLDASSALNPSLSAEYLRFRASETDAFAPLEFALVPSLSPTVRVQIGETEAPRTSISISVPGAEARDITRRFSFSSTESAMVGELGPELVGRRAYQLEVYGPLILSASFLVINEAGEVPNVVIPDESVPTSEPGLEVAQGQFVVVFVPGTSVTEMTQLLQSHRIIPVGYRADAATVICLVSSSTSLKDTMQAISANSIVGGVFALGWKRAGPGSGKHGSVAELVQPQRIG